MMIVNALTARTIGVENTCDANFNPILVMEPIRQSFGNAFALIVAGARANGINVTPASPE